MEAERVRGLMGLCVRAGQTVFGEDGCMKALRNGDCAVLLMDGDISPRTEEKYRRLCLRTGVPVVKLPAGWLEEATGRPGMAMAVRTGRLAEQLVSRIRCGEE